jgi:hypothetical protein
MRTFLGVTISALVVMGILIFATRGSAERRACKHMFDLTEQQLEKMGDFGGRAEVREMRSKLREQRDTQLDQCEAGLERLDIDPSCILDAETLDAATECVSGKLRDSN